MTVFHQDWFNELEINQRIAEKDGDLYHKLVNFATSMEPLLNHEPEYKPIAYTPHDFSHHIKNVLGNMSALLHGRLDLFSIEELFCLQCACIAHDIDMAYNPKGRPIHTFNGGAIINDRFKYDVFALDKDLEKKLKIFEDAGTVGSGDANDFADDISKKLTGFIKFLMLDNAMNTEAISWIVLGHSDIKLKDCVIPTLELECYQHMEEIFTRPGRKPFQLRVMAALLRWADELDCSQYRLPSPDLEPVNADSKSHWETLHIIRAVKINNQHVELILDDRDFSVKSDKPYDLLHKQMEKLNTERDKINRCLKKMRFDFVIADLGDEQLICSPKIKIRYQEYRDQKKNPPPVADFNVEVLINEIKDYVCEYNLYKEGHFILHDDVNGESKDSVRNTFDCVGLLARHQFLDGISQALLNFLYTGSFNQGIPNLMDASFFLIGIANSGALLAAHMSFLAGLPYTYLVPMKKREQYTKWEQSIDDVKKATVGRHIVLVIGINHTGDSIREACDIIVKKLKKDKKEIHVMGFLNREAICDGAPPIEETLAKDGIRCKFLMKEYANDKCIHSDKKECPYKKKCMEMIARGVYI